MCAVHSCENAPGGNPSGRNCGLVGEQEQGGHTFYLDCKYGIVDVDGGALLSTSGHRAGLDHGRMRDGVRIA